MRDETRIGFQLWVAVDDVAYRLKPAKLLGIIGLSERKLDLPDAPIEVEYQHGTIGKYRFGVCSGQISFGKHARHRLPGPRSMRHCPNQTAHPRRRLTMQSVIIYHNPACGTSRNVLALIRNAGIESEIIEYLHHPPDSCCAACWPTAV